MTTHTPPKSLLRAVGRASGDYTLIRAGDRILLGLSGGKDSLAMQHLLCHLQRSAPIHFDIGAITIDPQVEGFDPSPLQTYVHELGLPHFFVQQPIMERAKLHMQGDSYCSWCARMKRGAMYATFRAEGYKVLALGQHLDDLAESFLLSSFHGGRLQTMKAHYLNNAGDMRIIRPLIYVRERQRRQFSETAGLPVIRDNCPACFRMPTQRQHMKGLLAQEETHNKGLFKALLSVIRPLMDEKSAASIKIWLITRIHVKLCKTDISMTIIPKTYLENLNILNYVGFNYPISDINRRHICKTTPILTKILNRVMPCAHA